MLKPVLLIRSDNNESDQAALQALGIPTLVDPYIAVNISADTTQAQDLLSLLESAEAPLWLIATSVNALKFWGESVGVERLRDAISANQRLRFAAIGETTANALRQLGAKDVYVPAIATGRTLADDLIATFPVGHALIPGGNLAMTTLPAVLISAGWQISTAITYTTSRIAHEPKSAQLVRDKEVSAVLFRSPSAVRALAYFVAEPEIPLICAGVTTAREVEEQGWTVSAISSEPSAEVVASTIYSILS